MKENSIHHKLSPHTGGGSSSENPQRKFVITPKETWEEVRNEHQKYKKNAAGFGRFIEERIIINTEEVVPENIRSKVSDFLNKSLKIPVRHNQQNYSIIAQHAFTIGVIAEKLELNLHDPEIVYMGTSLLTQLSFHQSQKIQNRIERIQNGESTFKDESQKNILLNDLNTSQKKFREYGELLQSTSKEYAKHYLPQNDTLLKILDTIPFYLKESRIGQSKIQKVFDNLRKKDYIAAYAKVEEIVILTKSQKTDPLA